MCTTWWVGGRRDDIFHDDKNKTLFFLGVGNSSRNTFSLAGSKSHCKLDEKLYFILEHDTATAFLQEADFLAMPLFQMQT